MDRHNVPAYLVNTGWIGASASSGATRISLPLTRTIIHAILDGSIDKCDFDTDPYFQVKIPRRLGEIDTNILNPIHAWSNVNEYHETARNLVKKFQKNYENYDLGDPAIRDAGPSI